MERSRYLGSIVSPACMLSGTGQAITASIYTYMSIKNPLSRLNQDILGL